MSAEQEVPPPVVVVEETPTASVRTTSLSPLARRYHTRNQTIQVNSEDSANLQDLYETMERDVLPLVKLIKQLMPPCLITDDNNSVFEPCCGNGAISNVFKILGYKTIERDLYTREDKHDFLQDPFPEEFDFIVTNPPYNGKKNFLLRAIESGKPFAMFVPIEILFMADMDRILDGHSVLVFSANKKPLFLRDGEYKCVGYVIWLVVDFPNIQKGITFKYYSY